MKFTVFTPTYNRSNTLTRVYESLVNQTMHDFEWLIIDDGSTDLTCNLVSHFIKSQKLFPIQYHAWRPSRGKHIAHNKALELANGDFFLVADSDDWIMPYALKRMEFHWNSIADAAGYCGVSGLCADRSGSIIGDCYPDCAKHSTLQERKFKYKLKGEKWGFMRTDLVRQCPFPEVDGFVPESVAWFPIGKIYKDYCVNEVFRIYDQSPRSSSVLRQCVSRALEVCRSFAASIAFR